jgi:endonuclease/exonuclease/phosphatase family metal-dependent hydrolase
MGPGLEFGNALLSRHPILEHQVLRLPGEESGETRCVLYAKLASPHGEVPVFVTHLNWKLHHGSVRVRQIKRLVEFVDERAAPGKTFPPVLMGDFNAEPESDEIRWLRGFATLDGQSVFFADAWAYGGDGGPGFTFDRRNPYAARSHEPPRRIDYIFVRGPDSHFVGEPLTTRVVFDQPDPDGVWASDHFGLYSEISATRSRAP